MQLGSGTLRLVESAVVGIQAGLLALIGSDCFVAINYTEIGMRAEKNCPELFRSIFELKINSYFVLRRFSYRFETCVI